MNTIQFTGDENKILNLHLALGISDNDMPQQSETRVYLIRNINDVMHTLLPEGKHYTELNDEDFMAISQDDGSVYSLEGFQEAFNNSFPQDETSIDANFDVMRFINVKI